MAANKKIKLILAVLIIFIICIFGLGYNLKDYETEEGSGISLWE